MWIFVIVSEYGSESWWFLVELGIFQLLQYLWNEVPNTWLWYFFLKRVVSSKEFDNLRSPNKTNPGKMGKNSNRLGSNSRNLKVWLQLIIDSDIPVHCAWLKSAKVSHWILFQARLCICGTHFVSFKKWKSYNQPLVSAGYRYQLSITYNVHFIL